MYKLIDRDGHVKLSSVKGLFGGHRASKIFGHLDCPSALRFIAAGKYVKHRVFFADFYTAVAAGYRPCAKCLPEWYDYWKHHQAEWLRIRKEYYVAAKLRSTTSA